MFEEYVVKGNRRLKCGYTTGSCAAAAAKAAAGMLLTGQEISRVELMTPKGLLLRLDIRDIVRGEGFVSCGVRKDGGDDPDVTDGLLICVRVEYAAKEGGGKQEKKSPVPQVFIDGGEGVGRVTLPGLEQPVGEAAINRVPRQMITEAVLESSRACGFVGSLKVTVFVPEGEERSARTFNPRLGIKGGISILGTTGIVEPMSESALINSIKVEMKVLLKRKNGYLVVIPGNYGTVFSKNELGIDTEYTMKCSNYIGETVDFAAELKVKGILFIGHIGKFIKLSGGIMNTHSRNADSRMELLAAAAIKAGAPLPVLLEILEAPTTDQGLEGLEEAGYLEPAMKVVTERAGFYLKHRSGGAFETEVMIFSNVYGLLGQTAGAAAMLERWKTTDVAWE